MSVFTAVKSDKDQSKVHHSQYILSEDKPAGADPEPATPVSPEKPEAK
jgi:hypothetical protein